MVHRGPAAAASLKPPAQRWPQAAVQLRCPLRRRRQRPARCCCWRRGGAKLPAGWRLLVTGGAPLRGLERRAAVVAQPSLHGKQRCRKGDVWVSQRLTERSQQGQQACRANQDNCAHTQTLAVKRGAPTHRVAAATPRAVEGSGWASVVTGPLQHERREGGERERSWEGWQPRPTTSQWAAYLPRQHKQTGQCACRASTECHPPK